MTKPLYTNKRSGDILKELLDSQRSLQWSANDLRAILMHQLTTPLISELDRFADLTSCSRAQVSSIIEACSCHSFGDLFQAAAPSISALRILKDYFKASLANEEDLPKEVARVFYVLSILRGRQIKKGAVSSLDDVSIERETRRCLTFSWLPDDIRELLHQSLKVVKMRQK